MSYLKNIQVHCKRGKTTIASYDFGYTDTIGASALPERNGLIIEAKTNLTNQGLAFPPYDDIEFVVQYPR